VASRKTRRKKKKKVATTVRPQGNEMVRPMIKSSTSTQRPSYAWEEGKKRQVQGQGAAARVLPRTPRASAVTVTLSEAAKTSYAEVLVRAKSHISLKELGVERVDMRKTATGAIVIRVPGDRERDKAAKSATKLSSVLDPAAVRIAAPIRRAELKIERIDVSVNKDELRHALAAAAECKEEEIQVGKIGIARRGLGTAWVRCPVAGAR
jgi:hypothetical protein